MRFLKTHRQIWIQSIVFLMIGICKHSLVFLILSACLFMLPFVSEHAARKYSHYLDAFLNKLGYQIKNVLFFFLYVFVLIPVALIKRCTGNKNKTGYTDRTKIIVPDDFEKMW